MSNALQAHFDTSLADNTASSLLDRVFSEIDKYNTQEYSEIWYENVCNLLRFSGEIEQGLQHSRAALLAVIKNKWDTFPQELRRQFGFSFTGFAKAWTGGSGVSTINAYVNTAELWILGEFGKGKRVEITNRAIDGKPILDDRAKATTKMVTFCPYTVDLSKLNILNPRARDDNMTKRLWEMLVDPFFSCDDVRKEHHAKDAKTKTYEYTVNYTLEGPHLIASQNGNAVEVAEFNWVEYDSNDHVKEAINNIIGLLNIKLDEDIIYNMIRENYAMR